MEESSSKGQSAPNWRSTFAQTIEDHRRGLRERINKERGRLQELDAELTAKLDEAAAQLVAAQQASSTSTAGLSERETSLKEWQQRLDDREQQLKKANDEFAKERERLQASLKEQLDLNRRQAESSREEAVRHATQLDQAHQESRAELERLRAAAVASKANAVQALSGKFEPLFTKLTEQESLLTEISSMLNQQVAQKTSSLPAETAAEMAALRQENKSLAARLKEADNLGKHIEPLVTRLTDQETTLSELSRKLDEQAAKKKTSASAEADAQLAALREENKTLVARLGDTHALREQFEPLTTRLAEQETLLGEMSRKLDEQAAHKAKGESAKAAAELAALREENKALIERQNEAAALSEQVKPLVAKFAKQEATLDELSRMMDKQAAQKTSSLPAETAAEMAALRQENKALAAQLKETQALSGQIEPLVTKLAEQEAMLAEMSRKQDEEAARKNSDTAAELDAQLAALREENKSLAARLSETTSFTERIEPLLAKLAEQEGLLGEMSRKLDDEAARKSAGTATDAAAQLAALREENKSLAARLSETSSFSERIEPLLTRLTEQEAMLGELNHKLDQQAAQTTSRPSAELMTELADLREENKILAAQLSDAKNAANSNAEAGSGGSADMDDLRRRFEMAVQDVRELKTKNAELTEQLANAKQKAASGVPAATGGGWESLKQKLLSELETDFDENDSQQKADKLTVQGAIKITDDVVAEKEREVAELRRLLETQAQQVGEVAVGAAAVSQLLDTDELVRQERESLKRLQDSLREQLKQAEVDSSLERAKLARERMELEEKARVVESEKAQLPLSGNDAAGDKSKPGSRRKWLARLGLGDGKDE